MMKQEIPKCNFCKKNKATHHIMFGKIDKWNFEGKVALPDATNQLSEFVACNSCARRAWRELTLKNKFGEERK